MKGKHRGIILEYSDGPNVIMGVFTSRDPFIAGGREIGHEKNLTHFASFEDAARKP